MKSIKDTAFAREIETTSRRLSSLTLAKSKQEEGIIESVMTVNRTVYVIARRFYGVPDEESHHSAYGLFNNDRNADEKYLSPFELLIPISNIDLGNSSINPKDLLGKNVMVTVLKGRAIKAEYIGELSNYKQSPLEVVRQALENARSLAGATSKITDGVSKEYLSANFNLTEDQLSLIGMSLEEFTGKIVRVEGDAVYNRDTATKLDNELIIESHDIIRNTNKNSMKTKNCHLPTTVFTAR